jgi:hypothetical protein
MMVKQLPPRPNLEQLKKQAKDILKAHRRGDPNACSTLQHLRRFASASPAVILDAAVTLQEVQHAVAVDYGFRTWSDLKRRVDVTKEKEMKTQLSRADGVVVIDGVEKLSWESGFNTAMGSIGAVARALGDDVSYEYLMGVSGTAFRLHFHQPNWCPSSPDATVGFDHTAPVMRALGYTTETIFSHADRPEEVRKVRETIVASIDRGLPVVATDLIAVPDWGVITGYADSGEHLVCRTYHDKTSEYSVAEKWPWIIMVIRGRQAAPDRQESIRKSLEIALTVSHTPAFGKYASGFAAYDRWVADLQDTARFAEAEEGEIGGRMHINGWCYRSLLDARTMAGRYLQEISEGFEADAGASLSRAVAAYGALVTTLKAGLPHAPMPWTPEAGGKWTQAMRDDEADVLRKAKAQEQEAIGEIEEVLQTRTS